MIAAETVDKVVTGQKSEKNDSNFTIIQERLPIFKLKKAEVKTAASFYNRIVAMVRMTRVMKTKRTQAKYTTLQIQCKLSFALLDGSGSASLFNLFFPDITEFSDAMGDLKRKILKGNCTSGQCQKVEKFLRTMRNTRVSFISLNTKRR